MTRRADELRGDAEALVDGRLSIDALQAREKLQRFRLPDPHLYVLQFVKAAVALQAETVAFSFTPMTVECVFDGVFLPRTLHNVWEHAFGRRRLTEHEAVRYLALGVSAMQAFEPRRIEVTSSIEQWVIEGEEERFGEDIYARRGHTSIVMHDRLRPRRLPDFARRIAGDAPEVGILRKYCRLAPLAVRVHGYRIDRSPRLHAAAQVSVDSNQATVGLSGERASVRILDHGVELEDAAFSLPRHWRWARGWVHTTNIATDFSGLSPVRKGDYERLRDRLAFGAYHKAIATRLDGATDAEKRALLFTLVRWAQEAWSHGDLLEETDALFRRLLRQSVWTRAGARRDDRKISMTEVIHDGVLSYCDVHRGADVLEVEPVLFRADWLDREMLEALGELRGFEVVDRTGEIAGRRRRLTNLRRWEGRARRRDPTTPFVATREVGPFEVIVYLPIQVAASRANPPQLRLFVGGRLLQSEELPPGVCVDLDGPFTPTADFSSVQIDERVASLLDAAREASDEVWRMFASAHTRHRRLHPERARILRQRLLRRHDRGRLYRALSLEPPISVTPSTEVADAMRAVPCLDLYGRSVYFSLDTVPAKGVHVLERTGGWEEFARATAVGGVDLILAEPGELDAYRDLLGDRFRDARSSLESLVSERHFLDRPLYDPPLDRVLEKGTIDIEGGTLVLRLVAPRAGPVVDLQMLYRGRRLTERQWTPDVGSFVGELHCRTPLGPNTTFDDAGPQDALQQARHETLQFAGELLDRWTTRADDLDDVKLRALWFRAVMGRGGPFPKSVPCFPLVDGHRTRLVSWHDVDARARESGATLGLVERIEQATDERPYLLSHAGPTAAHVRDLFSHLELVFAIDDATAAEFEAEFRRRPTIEMKVPDAVFDTTIDTPGLTGVIGLVDDAERARGVHLRILHESRVLEEVEFPVPFGRFEALIEGPSIVADPSYTMALRGHRRAIDVTRAAAARLVRQMCENYSAAGHGAAGERRVATLLDFHQVCLRDRPLPPFDLAEVIASCPMLRTGDGTNTSLARLARFPDAIPYTAEATDEPTVLVATERRRAAIGRVLPDATFVDASSTSARLEVLLLARIAIQLRRVRGEREDLIGDDLIQSLRWVTDPAPHDPVCRVTAEGVFLRRDAAIFESLTPTDPLEIAIVGSIVATEINRFYREFSDFDELEIHRRLLADAVV